MQKNKYYVALQEKRNATSKPHSGFSAFYENLKESFLVIREYCERSECSDIVFCISRNNECLYKGKIKIPCDGIYNYTYSIYNGKETEYKMSRYNYDKFAA